MYTYLYLRSSTIQRREEVQRLQITDIPPRASKYSQMPGRQGAQTPMSNRPVADDLAEDDRYYPVRPSSSAIRYTSQDQVIQQGNKRIIIHHEPPPTRRQGQPAPA